MGGYGDGRDAKSVTGQFVVDFGTPVFASACNQKLDMWNGRETITGKGVRMRATAWEKQDVIALEIEDTRETPPEITVDFTMPLPAKIAKNSYSCEATFSEKNDALVLAYTIQDPGEGHILANRFYCASACAVGVAGRDAKIETTKSPSTRHIRIQAGRGKFTLLVSTGATMKAGIDPTSVAANALRTAKRAGTDALFDAAVTAWHDFWKHSFIYLPGSKGLPALKTADGVWAYYLYSLNTINRGEYPINNTGGGVFATGLARGFGWCEWGSKYWFFDVSRQALVSVFESAGHPELADPWLSLFDKHYERFHQAARQQWGCKGDAVYVPEVFSFDGPEVLPDDIAHDLTGMYLNQVRTDKLRSFAQRAQYANRAGRPMR